MQKSTYHSNHKYSVCVKINSDDQTEIKNYINIDGKTIEIFNENKKLHDNFKFNFNEIF